MAVIQNVLVQKKRFLGKSTEISNPEQGSKRNKTSSGNRVLMRRAGVSSPTIMPSSPVRGEETYRRKPEKGTKIASLLIVTT